MEKVVFTNGCFDILHPGHIDLLARARGLGTRLVVGINSDRSVRAIKGEGRPLQNEDARKAVLAGLASVDEVVIFDELTPENLIKQIKPDVLVKGGDWKENEIIGADFVKANGGEVHSLPLKDGFSTSDIVAEMSNGNRASGNNTGSAVADSLTEHLSVLNDIAASQGATLKIRARDIRYLPSGQKSPDLRQRRQRGRLRSTSRRSLPDGTRPKTRLSRDRVDDRHFGVDGFGE